MTFFYDLNKRLAALAGQQDAKQIAEDAKATAPKSKLVESMEVVERSTGDYSAKKARAGKDIGKPGKNFAKIAKSSGGGEKGQRIAGAVLAKLRKPTEEGVDKAAFAKLAPPTDKITFADKIAGAKKEVDEMLGDVAADAIKSAITKGRKGEVTKTAKGIKHRATKAYGGEEDKPHALDRLKGPSAKQLKVADADLEEGYAEMDAWLKQREKEKGTGKFDVKDTGYSKRYTRKEEPEASDDEEASTEPKRRGRPKGAPKGPERTTKGAWKHKGERKVKEDEQEVCEHCGQAIVEKAKAKKEGLKKHSDSELKAAAGKDREADKKSGVPAQFKTSQVKDELKKRSKEEKVDETTVAGSVATATTSGKSSKGGMQFGKGVYEGFNNSVENLITESVTVESSMTECGDGMGQGVTVTADGEDAAKLMALLKLAGLTGDEALEENQPDWPTNTETSNDAFQYSGGLNKPKSTGQTTTPVIASQLRRQVSMEESVELERSLFKTWKNYKG